MADPPKMVARDILSPSATLLGFVFSLIGLSIAIGFDDVFIKNLTILLIGVVIIIVISASLTVLSSVRNRASLWRWARISYIASWVSIGIISIMILIGNTFGWDFLNISLPEFNEVLATPILMGLSIILGYYFSQYGIQSYKEEISVLLKTLSYSDSRKAMNTVISTISAQEESDKEMIFLKIAIDIERVMREIMKIVGEDPNSYEYRSIMNIFEYFSKKQFVNDDIIDAFSFVRKLRNIIAHGGTAGDEDLNRATDLAAFLLTEFNDLKDRLSQG